MALRDQQATETKKLPSSRRGVLATASWVGMGTAVTLGGVLLLWLWSDIDSQVGLKARPASETDHVTKEARRSDAPRLRALPARAWRSVEADAGGASAGLFEDVAEQDAGAFPGVVFVTPVLVPSGEAPPRAEDTGLIFSPQANPVSRPGSDVKQDEPLDDLPSHSDEASLKRPLEPSVAVPAPIHERTASGEEPPPVERSHGSGLIFSDSPSPAGK
jgi:hypothetical protein